VKGCIINCLKESIINNYGKDKWEDIAIAIELPPIIIDSINIDDALFIEALNYAQPLLNISWEDLFVMFAEQWIFSYAHTIGFAYFLNKHKTSRDALFEMDKIHKVVTINMIGSKPPSFKCVWLDDNTLLMDYFSERDLIDMAVALIKALGKYYNDHLKIEKVDGNRLEIKFFDKEEDTTKY
jgi:hypothetical protein